MPSSVRRLLLLVAACGLLPLAGPRPSGGEDVYAQEKCSLCHIRESVFFDRKLLKNLPADDLGEERVCQSCHNGSVRDDRAVLWRGAQHPAPGGRGPRPCSRCHSPHGRGGWGVLSGTGIPLIGGGDALCGGCHPDHRSRGSGLHARSFPSGGCQECHRAHGGVGKALLRDAKGPVCLRCHAGSDPARSGGHATSEGRSEKGAARKLPDCTGCHPVHAGNVDARSTVDAQCAECHGSDDGRGKAAASGHRGATGCTSCHVFHARAGSDGKGLRGRDMRTATLCGRCHPAFAAEGQAASRERGTHVTPAGAGQAELCLACHSIHKGVPGTPLLTNTKSYSCLECHRRHNPILEDRGASLAHPEFERIPRGRLEAAIRLRRLYIGPAGEIACRTCHAVHGAAPGTPLLASGFSGDENCLWCHEDRRADGHSRADQAGAAVRCATCHPVHGIQDGGPDPWKTLCTACHPVAGSHVPARGDREKAKPKDLPLFDPRGRSVAIGGISCPTCHDPHGTPAREKRTRRPYAQSGFLCTACHREEETIALTPHDLRGIAGKSVCEPCHKPHGGSFPGMWGLPSAREANGDRCRACHREKGLGTPVSSSGHPVDMIVLRPLPRVYPLFGEGLGIRLGGAMTCATCHDVHGTGFVPQGQGTGKLLRAFGAGGGAEGSVEPACLPCHPGREISHGNSSCSGCHPPHREPGSCGGCHRKPEDGVAAKHAAAGKDCGSCHRLHGKGERFRRLEDRCLECHPRAARIAGTPHAELGAGVCRSCHPAHSRSEVSTTKRRAWDEAFAADAPCARCHREGGDGPVPRFADHPKNKRKVPTTYGATVVMESPIVMAGRLQEGGKPLFPLFSDNGVPSLTGRPGCLTCHDPHAGSASDQGVRTAGGYLRDPTGAFLAEICSKCHRGDVADRLRRFHVLPRRPD